MYNIFLTSLYIHGKALDLIVVCNLAYLGGGLTEILYYVHPIFSKKTVTPIYQSIVCACVNAPQYNNYINPLKSFMLKVVLQELMADSLGSHELHVEHNPSFTSGNYILERLLKSLQSKA